MRSDSETPPALLLAHVLQYYVYDYSTRRLWLLFKVSAKYLYYFENTDQYGTNCKA